MRRRSVLIGSIAIAALSLTACSGDDSASGDTTVTSSAASTTVASTTSAPTSSAAPTTARPTTSAPTTSPTSGSGVVAISVSVGIDDATTLGDRTETVPLGSQVEITLSSDSDETYHLHGYDIEVKGAAGTGAKMRFTADQAGTFELESHTTEDLLLTLVVS